MCAGDGFLAHIFFLRYISEAGRKIFRPYYFAVSVCVHAGPLYHHGEMMAELKAMDRDLHPESEHLSVTTRAFCVGIAVTFLVNLLPAYSAYIVHSSRMVFAHLPMATMVIFTVLAWPLNVLMARVKPQWALSQGEMVVVFRWGGLQGLCLRRILWVCLSGGLPRLIITPRPRISGAIICWMGCPNGPRRPITPIR